jgi:flagellar hook-length control protein FliK
MPAHFCAWQGTIQEKIRGFPWQKFWSGPCYRWFGFVRIFILASLSTNAIAVPNNAGTSSAKANASDSPPDGSPFAVMLAATAAQPSSPQPSSPQQSSSQQPSSQQSPSLQASSQKSGAQQSGTSTSSSSSSDASSNDSDVANSAQAQATQTSAIQANAAQTSAAQASAAQASVAQTFAALASAATASGAQPSSTDSSAGVKPAGKNASKDTSAANDNSDASLQAAALAASTQAQPDPAVQPAIQAQLAAQAMPLQAVAANNVPANDDDGSDSQDVGAVGANTANAATQTANFPTDPALPAGSALPADPSQLAAANTVSPALDPGNNQPQIPNANLASPSPAEAIAAALQTASNGTPSSAAANPPVPAPGNNQAAQTPQPSASPAAARPVSTATPSSTAAVNPPAPDNTQTAPIDASLAAMQPASTASAAAAKSPTAAAQAAIKGADNDSKSATAGTDRPAAQIADAVPQQQQQPPQQPAQQPDAASLPVIPAAPVHTADAAAPSSSVQVTAQSPTPDVASLAVAIAARSQSGARQFDIRLDPPELGCVEVRLSIDASGKAEAHMTADQPGTLSLLQKDSGSLTQALRDAGLDVSDNGLNFSLRSGQQGQDNSGQGGSAPRVNLAASLVVDSVPSPSTTSFTGDGDARLDISV